MCAMSARPRKPDSERAEAIIQIRITRAEKDRWVAAAKAADMSLTDWLSKAARQLLKKSQ